LNPNFSNEKFALWAAPSKEGAGLTQPIENGLPQGKICIMSAIANFGLN